MKWNRFTHPLGVLPLQSSLSQQISSGFPEKTLMYFCLTGSQKAEALWFPDKPVLQGVNPCQDRLASLETADSHGVCSLTGLLTG